MVLRYAHVASQHAKSMVDLIKNKLHDDTQKRLAGQSEEIGFAFAFKQNSILQNVQPAELVKSESWFLRRAILNPILNKYNIVCVYTSSFPASWLINIPMVFARMTGMAFETAFF